MASSNPLHDISSSDQHGQANRYTHGTGMDKHKIWNSKWNVYKERNEKQKSKPLFKSCEQYLKIPFGIFLFCMVVGFGTLSRITLHTMIWHLQPPIVNDTSTISSMNHQLRYHGGACADELCTRYVDEGWVWSLFLVITTPYLLCVFSAFRRMCRQRGGHGILKRFRSCDKITTLTFTIVVTSEILDTIGVCLMTFMVLPSYDPVTSSVVYLSVGLIPCLMDAIEAIKTFFNQNLNHGKEPQNVIKNGKPVTHLNGAMPTTSKAHAKDEIIEENLNETKDTFHHKDNTDSYSDHLHAKDNECKACPQPSNIQTQTFKRRMIPFGFSIFGLTFRIVGVVFLVIYGAPTIVLAICIFMVACRNFENFPNLGSFHNKMKKIIHINRTLLVLISNIMKILTALFTVICVIAVQSVDASEGLSVLFGSGSTNFSGELSDVEFGNDATCADYIPFVIGFINILSTLCLFKAAKAACSITCQIFSFSIPLTLCAPLLTIILHIHLVISTNELDFKACDLFYSKWSVDSLSSIGPNWWRVSVAFSLIVISYIFCFRHIYLTNGIRQGKTKRLFILPYYCGVFTELSMIANRRQDEEEYTLFENEKRDFLKDETKMSFDKTTVNNDEISRIPKIYACATMWHETHQEMTQLVTSIIRMDRHQKKSQLNIESLFAENKDKMHDATTQNIDGLNQNFRQSIRTEYLREGKDEETGNQQYDFEAHIFFDDAFQQSKNGKRSLYPRMNNFVQTLMTIIEPAISAVYRKRYKVKNSTFSTPYGGRIEWILPGGNKLIAHLKDKLKIRTRKRWSQVMYMYYLIGYREHIQSPPDKRTDPTGDNTFILALDGDVDFEPHSVMHLLNRMKKDSRVGSACGRIHPIGSGVMVWYQKFEYAVTHWLQKAAEHVTGCVLCSPGCFSMFRASSLADTNVMRTYTTEPTQALHYLKYEQGEDRWLCTLLLKQGYRIDYVAEADALTYAPEGFTDFWKQRRRWTPSTMANMIDLLQDNQTLIRKNTDISNLFIAYQMFLFLASVLAPGTIFLLIVGAILIGFPETDPLLCLLFNVIPVGLFMLACVFARENVQLMFASILSAVYSILQLFVLMGLIKSIVDTGFCSVTAIIFCIVGGIFIIAAILHPEESSCVLHGLLFFVAIPAMSMLMFFYSLGNMNNIHWGTRENSTGVTESEESLLQRIIRHLRSCCCCVDDRKASHVTFDKTDNHSHQSPKILGSNDEFDSHGVHVSRTQSVRKNSVQIGHSPDDTPDVSSVHLKLRETRPIAKPTNDLEEDDSTLCDRLLREYDCTFQNHINEEEIEFWEGLIEEYLKPRGLNDKKKKEDQEELLQLRNKACIIVYLLNAILVTLVFTLSEVPAFNQSLVIRTQCGTQELAIEPLSFVFTFTFGILLLIQFICMIYHRFSTIIHITAETTLCKNSNKQETIEDILLDPEAAEGHTEGWEESSTQNENFHERSMSVSLREDQPLNLESVVKKNVKQIKVLQKNPNRLDVLKIQREKTEFILKFMNETISSSAKHDPQNNKPKPKVNHWR